MSYPCTEKNSFISYYIEELCILENRLKTYIKQLIILDKLIPLQDHALIVQYRMIEQSLMRGIVWSGKVISSYEEIYKVTFQTGNAAVEKIKKSIEDLRRTALFNNDKIKEVLRSEMNMLKQKIIIQPKMGRRSSFHNSKEAFCIDKSV